MLIALNREENASQQKTMGDSIDEGGGKWDPTQYMTIEKLTPEMRLALKDEIPIDNPKDYWILHDGNTRAATIAERFPNITTAMAVEAKAEGIHRHLLFTFLICIYFIDGFPCIPLSHALAISRLKNVTAHNVRAHCILDDMKCMMELMEGDAYMDYNHPMKIIDEKSTINFPMLMKRMVCDHTSLHLSCSL